MGFEEDRSEHWRDERGPQNGKRELLRAAVEMGGVITGYCNGNEFPYDGANVHAEELRAEGFLRKHHAQPVADVTIWEAITPSMRGILRG